MEEEEVGSQPASQPAVRTYVARSLLPSVTSVHQPEGDVCGCVSRAAWLAAPRHLDTCPQTPAVVSGSRRSRGCLVMPRECDVWRDSCDTCLHVVKSLTCDLMTSDEDTHTTIEAYHQI